MPLITRWYFKPDPVATLKTFQQPISEMHYWHLKQAKQLILSVTISVEILFILYVRLATIYVCNACSHQFFSTPRHGIALDADNIWGNESERRIRRTASTLMNFTAGIHFSVEITSVLN